MSLRMIRAAKRRRNRAELEARRQELRAQHEQGETAAWWLFRSCEQVRSCTRERLVAWNEKYSELFLGKNNSPQSRNPVDGKSVPLSRVQSELDIPRLAWAVLTQAVGLHWALRIEDVGDRVDRVRELLVQFRDDLKAQLDRILEGQYKIPLVRALVELETALGDVRTLGASGQRVRAVGDDVLHSIATWLKCEPNMPIEQAVSLHELWARILAIVAPWQESRGPERANAARKSFRELVERLHEDATPWSVCLQREHLVRLVMAHRLLVEEQDLAVRDLEGWDDGLPFPKEPVLHEDDQATPGRQRALRFVGAEVDATQTIATEFLEELADADWEDYSRRVCDEFEIRTRMDLVRNR